MDTVKIFTLVDILVFLVVSYPPNKAGALKLFLPEDLPDSCRGVYRDVPALRVLPSAQPPSGLCPASDYSPRCFKLRLSCQIPLIPITLVRVSHQHVTTSSELWRQKCPGPGKRFVCLLAAPYFLSHCRLAQTKKVPFELRQSWHPTKSFGPSSLSLIQCCDQRLTGSFTNSTDKTTKSPPPRPWPT